MSLNKKISKNTVSHVDAEEYIPYAAHFDEETILTKNGELMQVIKVTGFSYETIVDRKKKTSPLRSIIRKSILNNVTSDDFAIWINTVRSRKDISLSGRYENKFSKFLHEKWKLINDWQNQYVNELYISIIIEGEALSVKNPVTFFEAIKTEKMFKKRNDVLFNKYNELTEVTDRILKDLEEFGARRLGVKKRAGIYCSEIMGFISKIMHFKDVDIALEPSDLSLVFKDNDINFYYNTVMVEDKSIKADKRYGAIFTVKEFHEVSTQEIDKFLQLPVQFTVTESFDFLPASKVLEEFEEQKLIYELSKDSYMEKVSGIKDLFIANKGNKNDYCQHQITICISEKSVRDLQYGVNIAVETLRNLGVVFIREDLYMEDCFWAQIPANFDFICRNNYITTQNVAGYASLYNFPAGKLYDNYWGDAVTVFRTAYNTPYFFNFHTEDNGHSMIVGPYGAGKTVLLNFLVSEAQKFNCRTVYFEKGRGSEVFINAIGGDYYRVYDAINSGELKMNPLLLPDNPLHHKYLRRFFRDLILYTENIQGHDITLDEAALKKIEDAVLYNYSVPIEQRRLSNIVPLFWDKSDGIIFEHLSKYYGDGIYSKYFDNDEDNLNLGKRKIVGFDISVCVEKKTVLIPLMAYLLFLAEESFEFDTRELIVLDEAWDILDNPAFGPHLSKWLQRLKKKNALCIFATEAAKKAAKSSITNTLSEEINTYIFLPNNEIDESYGKIFNLDNEEIEAISLLKKKDRHFLLKHHEDTIIARLDLEGFDEELSILAANEKQIQIMHDMQKKYGSNPNDWMEKYFAAINQQEQ